MGGEGQNRMVFIDKRVSQAGKCLTVTNRDMITKLFQDRWLSSHVSSLQISAAGTLNLRHKWKKYSHEELVHMGKTRSPWLKTDRSSSLILELKYSVSLLILSNYHVSLWKRNVKIFLILDSSSFSFSSVHFCFIYFKALFVIRVHTYL